jgi:hypothetical protein
MIHSSTYCVTVLTELTTNSPLRHSIGSCRRKKQSRSCCYCMQDMASSRLIATRIVISAVHEHVDPLSADSTGGWTGCPRQGRRGKASCSHKGQDRAQRNRHRLRSTTRNGDCLFRTLRIFWLARTKPTGRNSSIVVVYNTICTKTPAHMLWMEWYLRSHG